MNAVELATLVELACLLEASAAKPGNVSPNRPFSDTRYEDFVASALAIGPILGCAASRPLGMTVRLAIEATRRWTRRNTNLGIVLLLTPLARAACRAEPLRLGVGRELAASTIEDAREVYAAIRLAAPGGLGRSKTQDVSAEPTVTLLESMQIAAARDAIAREYATAFATTFDVAVPALRSARTDGLPWSEAIVETFMLLLATIPDTHIARRAGAAVATTVSAKARGAIEAGGIRNPGGRRALADLDAQLRGHRNSLNPGATADLTAAAIFVTLLEDGWDTNLGNTNDRP